MDTPTIRPVIHEAILHEQYESQSGEFLCRFDQKGGQLRLYQRNFLKASASTTERDDTTVVWSSSTGTNWDCFNVTANGYLRDNGKIEILMDNEVKWSTEMLKVTMLGFILLIEPNLFDPVYILSSLTRVVER